MTNWLAQLTRNSGNRGYLRSRLLADPYYRFQSVQEVQLAAELGIRIDVNKASIDDWLRLPGLSIHQARVLVQLTQSGVSFLCLEDVAAALSLPVPRLQPLGVILQFCYYDADGPCSLPQVNPNTATVEELVHLPPVDLALARVLVRDRIQRGPYRNLAELQQRLALSGTQVTELMHYLRF